jgi:hypothetical protein
LKIFTSFRTRGNENLQKIKKSRWLSLSKPEQKSHEVAISTSIGIHPDEMKQKETEYFVKPRSGVINQHRDSSR